MLTMMLLIACKATSPQPDDSTGRVVRLSHAQWENSVVDLLGLPGPTSFSEAFVPDTATAIFENNAAGLFVTPTLWQQYQSAAESLAELVVTDPLLYEKAVPLLPRRSPSAGAAERDAWILSFGRRAFRRNLSADERSSALAIFMEGADSFHSGDPFVDGIRACITAFLQSPSFLYRTEGLNSAGGTAELDSFELASKLSYALWNTMPDAALLDAAELRLTEERVRTETRRMLESEAAHEMIHDLHRQLLHVDGYENIERGFVSYEDYSITVPAAMQAEVYAYVDAVVFGGGDLADLLTSRHSFVDAQLAEIYSISGVVGIGAEALVPVELNPAERSGILTLSGFLKHHAGPTEPSLIGRGAFINTAFLCANLPAAPAGVPPLPPAEPEQTLRERIEVHTTDCGGACHKDLINPIGFAYGNYDEEGRYQLDEEVSTAAGGTTLVPVDATGTYMFDDGIGSYGNAVELAAVLAGREQVHRCYSSHLLSYMEGRALNTTDTERLSALTAASLGGRPILDLITDIVTDDTFRRAPAAP